MRFRADFYRIFLRRSIPGVSEDVAPAVPPWCGAVRALARRGRPVTPRPSSASTAAARGSGYPGSARCPGVRCRSACRVRLVPSARWDCAPCVATEGPQTVARSSVCENPTPHNDDAEGHALLPDERSLERHRWSLGGTGSFPGATVSESRICPLRPWITTSPPPLLPTISRALSIAAACVSVRALARPLPGFETCQPPSGWGVTWRSLRGIELFLSLRRCS